MKSAKAFWICILIPIVIGGISGLISKSGMEDFSKEAVMPPLQPPGIVFPIVWTILYLLMGYSLYRVVESGSMHAHDGLIAFAVQLFLNFAWTPVFFQLSAYRVAAVILVALLIAVIIMIVTFYKSDKLAGLLQIPYLLWLCFALYLNIATVNLNP